MPLRSPSIEDLVLFEDMGCSNLFEVPESLNPPGPSLNHGVLGVSSASTKAGECSVVKLQSGCLSGDTWVAEHVLEVTQMNGPTP